MTFYHMVWIVIISIGGCCAADMSWLTVRHAESADLKSICELDAAMMNELYRPWLYRVVPCPDNNVLALLASVLDCNRIKYFRRLEKQRRTLPVWVIEITETAEIIGFLCARVLTCHCAVIIETVYLAEPYRRRGIFRWLLVKVSELYPCVRRYVLEVLRCSDVDGAHSSAVTTYTALGFRPMSSSDHSLFRRWFPEYELFSLSDGTVWRCDLKHYYHRLVYEVDKDLRVVPDASHNFFAWIQYIWTRFKNA